MADEQTKPMAAPWLEKMWGNPKFQTLPEPKRIMALQAGLQRQYPNLPREKLGRAAMEVYKRRAAMGMGGLAGQEGGLGRIAQIGEQHAWMGASDLSNFLNDLAVKVGKLTHTEPGGLFKNIANALAEDPNQVIEPQSMAEKIVAGLTRGATGEAPKYAVAAGAAGPVAGFGALAGLESYLQGKDLKGTIGSIIEGLLMGKVFKWAEPMSRVGRGLTVGAAGAGEAALHGASTQDIVAQGAAMGLPAYFLGGPGESGRRAETRAKAEAFDRRAQAEADRRAGQAAAGEQVTPPPAGPRYGKPRQPPVDFQKEIDALLAESKAAQGDPAKEAVVRQKIDDLKARMAAAQQPPKGRGRKPPTRTAPGSEQPVVAPGAPPAAGPPAQPPQYGPGTVEGGKIATPTITRVGQKYVLRSADGKILGSYTDPAEAVAAHHAYSREAVGLPQQFATEYEALRKRAAEVKGDPRKEAELHRDVRDLHRRMQEAGAAGLGTPEEAGTPEGKKFGPKGKPTDPNTEVKFGEGPSAPFGDLTGRLVPIPHSDALGTIVGHSEVLPNGTVNLQVKDNRTGDRHLIPSGSTHLYEEPGAVEAGKKLGEYEIIQRGMGGTPRATNIRDFERQQAEAAGKPAAVPQGAPPEPKAAEPAAPTVQPPIETEARAGKLPPGVDIDTQIPMDTQANRSLELARRKERRRLGLPPDWQMPALRSDPPLPSEAAERMVTAGTGLSPMQAAEMADIDLRYNDLITRAAEDYGPSSAEYRKVVKALEEARLADRRSILDEGAVPPETRRESRVGSVEARARLSRLASIREELDDRIGRWETQLRDLEERGERNPNANEPFGLLRLRARRAKIARAAEAQELIERPSALVSTRALPPGMREAIGASNFPRGVEVPATGKEAKAVAKAARAAEKANKPPPLPPVRPKLTEEQKYPPLATGSRTFKGKFRPWEEGDQLEMRNPETGEWEPVGPIKTKEDIATAQAALLTNAVARKKGEPYTEFQVVNMDPASRRYYRKAGLDNAENYAYETRGGARARKKRGERAKAETAGAPVMEQANRLIEDGMDPDTALAWATEEHVKQVEAGEDFEAELAQVEHDLKAAAGSPEAQAVAMRKLHDIERRMKAAAAREAMGKEEALPEAPSEAETMAPSEAAGKPTVVVRRRAKPLVVEPTEPLTDYSSTDPYAAERWQEPEAPATREKPDPKILSRLENVVDQMAEEERQTGGKGKKKLPNPLKGQKGAITLYSFPTLPSIPGARKAIGALRGVERALKEVFAPQAIGSLSRRAAEIRTSELGHEMHSRNVLARDLDVIRGRFNWMGQEDLMNFADAYEHDALQATPELQELSRMWRGINEDQLRQLHEEAQKLRVPLLPIFYENYMPRWHVNAKGETATVIPPEASKQITGPADMFKPRTFTWAKDAWENGFRSLITNPVDLMALKASEMYKFIHGVRFFRQMRDEGLIRYGVRGVPGVWVDIGDPFLRKLPPPPKSEWINQHAKAEYEMSDEAAPMREVPDELRTGGKRLRKSFFQGQWYATPEVARVIQRTRSRGFRRDPITEAASSDTGDIEIMNPTHGGNSPYDMIRRAIHMSSMFRFGASVFHATTTTLGAATDGFSQGLHQVYRGLSTGRPDVVRNGVQQLSKVAFPPLQVISDYNMGTRMYRHAYGLENYGPETNYVVRRYIESGGNMEMSRQFIDRHAQALRDAWDSRDVRRVVGRAMPAMMEQMAKPIMEYLVPRAKMGAFQRRFLEAMEEAGPHATDAELASRAYDIQNHIDNVYGQLNYNKLFWDNRWKQSTFIAAQAPGWLLGTTRLMAGAVSDVLHGRWGTERVLYTLALPAVAGIYSTLMELGLTGKVNYDDPKNFMRHAIGGFIHSYNEDGSPNWLWMGTYMKDAYHWIDGIKELSRGDPREIESYATSKLNPVIEATTNVIANKEFPNTQMRDPDSPAYQQLFDTVASVAKTMFMPFSVQNYQRAARQGNRATSESQMRLGLFNVAGFSPLIHSAMLSDAERMMDRFAAEKRGELPTPQALIRKRRTIREILTDLRQGRPIDVLDLITRNGKDLDDRSIQRIAKQGLQSQFRAKLDQFTMLQVLQMYDASRNQKMRDQMLAESEVISRRLQAGRWAAGLAPSEIQEVTKRLQTWASSVTDDLREKKKLNVEQPGEYTSVGQ